MDLLFLLFDVTLSEFHLLQNRAAQKSVGIGHRLDDLKMVVPLSDEELNRFPCRSHRGRKVA